jgi:hypothetical protein
MVIHDSLCESAVQSTSSLDFEVLLQHFSNDLVENGSIASTKIPLDTERG